MYEVRIHAVAKGWSPGHQARPGNRYEIDLDYCKGCGICATECPVGAVDVLAEPT